MYVGHKNYVVLVEQNALMSSMSQSVNLTYSIVKKLVSTLCSNILRHKKYEKLFENLKLIDKTRVGGAVFAFHKRNCLLTKNLKAEYL